MFCNPARKWLGIRVKTDLVVAVDQGSGRVPETMLHMLSTAQCSCSHYSHHDTALPGSGLSRWISSWNLSRLGSRMLDNAGRQLLFGLLRGHACMAVASLFRRLQLKRPPYFTAIDRACFRSKFAFKECILSIKLALEEGIADSQDR